jgi:hypothetical protein
MVSEYVQLFVSVATAYSGVLADDAKRMLVESAPEDQAMLDNEALESAAAYVPS